MHKNSLTFHLHIFRFGVKFKIIEYKFNIYIIYKENTRDYVVTHDEVYDWVNSIPDAMLKMMKIVVDTSLLADKHQSTVEEIQFIQFIANYIS